MIPTSVRRVLVYTGVWTLIFIGFYTAFWRPGLGRLAKLQNQMAMQQTAIEQLKMDIATYPKTLTADNLKKVEEGLHRVFASIPIKEEISKIIQQIQVYGTQNNRHLTITGMANLSEDQKKENSAVAQGDSISKATYRIQIQGNVRDIIEFLYELESAARLISIQSFDLRRSSSEDTHSVNADIIINVFYSNPEMAGALSTGIPNPNH